MGPRGFLWKLVVVLLTSVLGACMIAAESMAQTVIGRYQPNPDRIRTQAKFSAKVEALKAGGFMLISPAGTIYVGPIVIPTSGRPDAIPPPDANVPKTFALPSSSVPKMLLQMSSAIAPGGNSPVSVDDLEPILASARDKHNTIGVASDSVAHLGMGEIVRTWTHDAGRVGGPNSESGTITQDRLARPQNVELDRQPGVSLKLPNGTKINATAVAVGDAAISEAANKGDDIPAPPRKASTKAASSADSSTGAAPPVTFPEVPTAPLRKRDVTENAGNKAEKTVPDERGNVLKRDEERKRLEDLLEKIKGNQAQGIELTVSPFAKSLEPFVTDLIRFRKRLALGVTYDEYQKKLTSLLDAYTKAEIQLANTSDEINAIKEAENALNYYRGASIYFSVRLPGSRLLHLNEEWDKAGISADNFLLIYGRLNPNREQVGK